MNSDTREAVDPDLDKRSVATNVNGKVLVAKSSREIVVVASWPLLNSLLVVLTPIVEGISVKCLINDDVVL